MNHRGYEDDLFINLQCSSPPYNNIWFYSDYSERYDIFLLELVEQLIEFAHLPLFLGQLTVGVQSLKSNSLTNRSGEKRGKDAQESLLIPLK